MYLCSVSTYEDTLRINRLLSPQSWTPPASQPSAPSPQQRLDSTPAPPPPGTRPRLLPLSSRDLPQPEEKPKSGAILALRGPAWPAPARPRAPHTPTRPPHTSGRRRWWRRLPRQREPYKMATAARASARPGPISRASSRTRECALAVPSPSQEPGDQSHGRM